MNLNLGNDIITKSSYIQDILEGLDIEPISKDIDTIRGIITQSALQRLKKQFQLQDYIYDYEDNAYQYKLEKAFIKIYSLTAPKNANALELCTKQRKPLTHYVFIEIFSLSQYDTLGFKIEKSKQLQDYIHKMINQDNLKRKWFILQSIDYAIDYKDKRIDKTILPSIILDTIEQNQSLLKKRFYPNCYIQNNNKENIAPYLQKVCIYDKSQKNRLFIENLIRVEFTINHNQDYFKDTTYKNYQIEDLFFCFDKFERDNDFDKLDKLKKRYKKAYETYQRYKDDPLSQF